MQPATAQLAPDRNRLSASAVTHQTPRSGSNLDWKRLRRAPKRDVGEQVLAALPAEEFRDTRFPCSMIS